MLSPSPFLRPSSGHPFLRLNSPTLYSAELWSPKWEILRSRDTWQKSWDYIHFFHLLISGRVSISVLIYFPCDKNLLSLRCHKSQSPIWILSTFSSLSTAQEDESKPSSRKIPFNVEILLSWKGGRGWERNYFRWVIREIPLQITFRLCVHFIFTKCRKSWWHVCG